MSASYRHLLIIGCGDTAVRVAARAVGAGERVSAIVRSQASAVRARAAGAAAWCCDLDEDDAVAVLAPLIAQADHLLYSAPPPREGETDTRMARVLSAASDLPARIVYISTSGVYGDHAGEWIDEDVPVAPTTARAKRRVDAERQLLAVAERPTILRAPAIYGPGRLPTDSVRAGEPVLDDADGWTNRIHIDDLAAICWQALRQAWPHTVYNACDGHPTRRTAFYDCLAEALELPPPPRIGWDAAIRQFSDMRLSFLAESRRLSNARLIADTGYRFIFDDYRDGVISSLRGEPAPD